MKPFSKLIEDYDVEQREDKTAPPNCLRYETKRTYPKDTQHSVRASYDLCLIEKWQRETFEMEYIYIYISVILLSLSCF
jgi:hypothetical protein